MPPKQITQTAENAEYLLEKYGNDPAGFLTDVVLMALDDWQRELCDNFFKYDRFAVSSGHSSGKSALTAGLIIFFLTMHPHPQVIVTANTEKQLAQKTWRELAKWHNRSLVKDWFKWTATKFSFVGAEETWFASAMPQTEHNSEAFAGAHEQYMLQIFDEASAIPHSIYEVSEGATATEGGYRKWLIFGNPTQNSGPFYDACFGSQAHRWHKIIIDTRKCRYADQEQIKAWQEDYGVDSDFFRVRVLGLPPQQSITTLIPQDTVTLAMETELDKTTYSYAPHIIGVDCARFGDDETVICWRQGNHVHEIEGFRGLNEIDIARKVADYVGIVGQVDAVYMDNTGGYGAGAFDLLQQWGFKQVRAINFATTDGVDPKYKNKRIAMWDDLRAWLATKQVSLPIDQHLERELVTPEFFYNKMSGQKQLEAKEDIKKRLGCSPDRSDALALTFAYPVQSRVAAETMPHNLRLPRVSGMDYDPLS